MSKYVRYDYDSPDGMYQDDPELMSQADMDAEMADLNEDSE